MVFVLGLILLFMGVGWPGAPDTCIHVVKGAAASNTCYCEAFDFHKVVTHASGVRQLVNTWLNLYAIGTSLWAAILLFIDRQSGNAQNVMRSNNPIADAYSCGIRWRASWLCCCFSTGARKHERRRRHAGRRWIASARRFSGLPFSP
jgi:hypothetical protein